MRKGRGTVKGGRAALPDVYDYMDEHGLQRGLNNALMLQRALARGVEVQAGRDNRLQMSFQGKSAWFNASNSSLNRGLVKRVAGNKAVTAAFLRAEGLQAPENAAFNADEVQRAWDWAEPIAPVVVKPWTGQEGRLVHLDLSTYADFEQAFTAVAGEGHPVLVEQYISGVDHRVTVVRGRVVGATRRVAAHVVGDGRATVEALVEAKNVQRRASRNPVHKELSIGRIESQHLARQGLTSTSIPAEGRTVWLRGAANVSTGGDAIDATDDLTAAEVEYIERAVAVFPGMRFCGVDVLLDRDSGADPWIVEVNSKPSVAPHHYPWEGQPRDVMTAVLEAMFPNLPPSPNGAT